MNPSSASSPVDLALTKILLALQQEHMPLDEKVGLLDHLYLESATYFAGGTAFDCKRLRYFVNQVVATTKNVRTREQFLFVTLWLMSATNTTLAHDTTKDKTILDLLVKALWEIASLPRSLCRVAALDCLTIIEETIPGSLQILAVSYSPNDTNHHHTQLFSFYSTSSAYYSTGDSPLNILAHHEVDSRALQSCVILKLTITNHIARQSGFVANHQDTMTKAMIIALQYHDYFSWWARTHISALLANLAPMCAASAKSAVQSSALFETLAQSGQPFCLRSMMMLLQDSQSALLRLQSSVRRAVFDREMDIQHRLLMMRWLDVRLITTEKNSVMSEFEDDLIFVERFLEMLTSEKNIAVERVIQCLESRGMNGYHILLRMLQHNNRHHGGEVDHDDQVLRLVSNHLVLRLIKRGALPKPFVMQHAKSLVQDFLSSSDLSTRHRILFLDRFAECMPHLPDLSLLPLHFPLMEVILREAAIDGSGCFQALDKYLDIITISNVDNDNTQVDFVAAFYQQRDFAWLIRVAMETHGISKRTELAALLRKSISGCVRGQEISREALGVLLGIVTKSSSNEVIREILKGMRGRKNIDVGMPATPAMTSTPVETWSTQEPYVTIVEFRRDRTTLIRNDDGAIRYRGVVENISDMNLFCVELVFSLGGNFTSPSSVSIPLIEFGRSREFYVDLLPVCVCSPGRLRVDALVSGMDGMVWQGPLHDSRHVSVMRFLDFVDFMTTTTPKTEMVKGFCVMYCKDDPTSVLSKDSICEIMDGALIFNGVVPLMMSGRICLVIHVKQCMVLNDDDDAQSLLNAFPSQPIGKDMKFEMRINVEMSANIAMVGMAQVDSLVRDLMGMGM